MTGICLSPALWSLVGLWQQGPNVRQDALMAYLHRLISALDLEDTEKQLRDYNRNITALFCVITDGVSWRFYYSKSQRQFSSKCFKDFNGDHPTSGIT